MIEFTLIALSGAAGAGKDTAADILQTHLGFFRLAFADALRHEICSAWSVEPVTLTARSTKEVPTGALALKHCADDAYIARMAELARERGDPQPDTVLTRARSPREIMQTWGTEYRRQHDPDYWVRQLARHIELLRNETHRTPCAAMRIVVTDCRFANEVRALRELDARLWAITRPGRRLVPQQHPSEVAGLEFEPDVVLNNGGDIHFLAEQVLSHYVQQAWHSPGARVAIARGNAGTAYPISLNPNPASCEA